MNEMKSKPIRNVKEERSKLVSEDKYILERWRCNYTETFSENAEEIITRENMLGEHNEVIWKKRYKPQ